MDVSKTKKCTELHCWRCVFHFSPLESPGWCWGPSGPALRELHYYCWCCATVVWDSGCVARLPHWCAWSDPETQGPRGIDRHEHLNSFQNRVFNKFKLLNTDLVWHFLMCQDCLTGDGFVPSWLWNLSSFSQGCQSWRRVLAAAGFHPLLPVMR